VFATIVRILVVCASLPIAGYANNLDFFRQSACVGVWQNDPGQPLISAHLAGPVNDLVYTGYQPAEYCIKSSDNIIVWIAARLHHLHDHMQLRELGLLKAALVTMLLAGVLMQPMDRLTRLVVASGFALSLGDITVIEYFNTMYVDASVLIFAAILIGQVSVLAAQTEPPSWISCVFIAACLCWLGATKPQFAALSAVFGVAAVACVAGRRSGLSRTILLAAASCAAPFIWSALNPADIPIIRDIGTTNIADVAFTAVLRNSTDKPRALETIGLPSSCLVAIGPIDREAPKFSFDPCPEIRNVSRVGFLPLFLQDPPSFFGPILVAIDASQQAQLRDLPAFARPQDARRWRFRILRATSVSTLFAWLPKHLYAIILAAASLGGTILFLPWLAVMSHVVGRKHRMAFQRATPGILGGFCCAYTLVSAVFGDGYIELERHAAAVLVGLGFVLTGAVGMAVSATLSPARAAQHPGTPAGQG